MASFIKDNAVVVVGVDYSQNSSEALRIVCEMTTKLRGLAVQLVHVGSDHGAQTFAGISHPFLSSEAIDGFHAESARLEALTQRTFELVHTSGAQLFGHLRTGDAAREIVQLATDLSSDLIVVGTHGRTGLKKLLIGSVAQNVLTNAPCPVLVVKPDGLPRWPEIDPPCRDCVAAQQSTQGHQLWCERHSKHHLRASPYRYSTQSDNYGLGAQTFRGPM